ncbi:MAG: hypothetical protein IT269_04530 [Saprospiraceae bacterium]|nr:hypothetical protein [Saprospiraceae bacterium]
MRLGLFCLLVLLTTFTYGQANFLFSGNPITFSDKNEIPQITKLVEEFKRDSSLNNNKILDNEFQPYLEMIQHSTVVLTKFKLVGENTKIDFLDEYKSGFVAIDKSPLYCFCHEKRFILNQEGQLKQDDKGDYYKILVLGVGKEGFSDLAFVIILKDSEFSSAFMHFDKMDYRTLRSNFTEGESVTIYSKTSKLILENSENGYLIGRFEMMSKELPTEDSLDYHFDISGEFSCKIK